MNRITVLLVLVAFTVSFAAADTNAVVASEEKCQQASSASMGLTSVKANVDVVQVVGRVPPDSNFCIKDRKGHEFTANCGCLIAFGIFALMLIFNVLMIFNKKITECHRRALSMCMLMLLVGLIAFCTFTWVERVMRNCNQSRKIFRSELGVNRLSKSDAVLEAYDQLNSELSRWFTMFAVLGTFFGLVLPIGGYLLQLKEIDRRKKEIDEGIDKGIQGYKDEMFRTREKLEKETEECRNSLANVQKNSTDLKEFQLKSSLNLMKFAWVKFLFLLKRGNVAGREIARPLYQAAEALMLAYKSDEIHSLDKCVTDVARVIDVYRHIVSVKNRNVEHEKFKDFVKRNRYLIGSPDTYNLSDKMGGETSALREVLKFMNEFGITMFGEVGG